MSKVSENRMFPFAQCLVLAWQAIAKLHNKSMETAPVIFKNVSFKKCGMETDEEKLSVSILPNSGNFEVYNNGEVFVNGTVQVLEDLKAHKIMIPVKSVEKLVINAKDIAKELLARGYDSTESIRYLKSSNIDADVGYIAWEDWPTFINAMFYFDVLKKNTTNLYIVECIDSILIDPESHTVAAYTGPNVPIFSYEDKDMVVAGGIQISGLKWKLTPNGKRAADSELCDLADGAKKPFDNMHLVSSPSGDLSSLRWVQSPPLVEAPNTVACDVYFAGLSRQDLVYVSGREMPGDQLSEFEDPPLGQEFSGRTSSGKRVMGLARRGLASAVAADERFLWQVPSSWSLEAAATVPAAYFSAYYALFVRGQLKPRQSVVVYNGCSELGYAAITLALHRFCTVFSTYDAREQRAFIPSKFLEVPDHMNGHHWDPAFEKKVLERTKGRGVDVVVNLLGRDKVPAALSCLAEGGTFLDLEDQVTGNSGGNYMNLSALLSGKTFHSVSPRRAPAPARLAAARLLAEGVDRGEVSPIHADVFPAEHVREAFERCGAAERVGKVVVRVRQGASGEVADAVRVLPRTYLDKDKTYVVIDGARDISVELVNWLISRGATRLLLKPHGGGLSGYQIRCIKKWRDIGIDVIITTQDTSSVEGVKKLLEDAATAAPVGGVFDLTAVLPERDASGQLEETKVVQDMKLLEKSTRTLIQDLRHFVIFISGKDKKMADFINKLIQNRKKDKLPGVLINLGSTVNVASDKINSEVFFEENMKAAVCDLDKLLT